MRRPLLLILTCAVLLAGEHSRSAERAVIDLDPVLRERCLVVLRLGLKSDEFWPALHAAEALTLAGHKAEVLAALASRTAGDDQQQCGLAREAVRAGDRTKIRDLLTILQKPGSIGHTHAAESLFKVAEVGDGTALRACLAEAPDVKLQLMAAAALARCGHPTALDLVRRSVTDSSMEQRMVAAWILGQLGTSHDIGSLKKGLATETDSLAGAFFVNALACLGDQDAKRTLGGNLRSDLPAVRTYSAEFAGYCRATELRDELTKRLDDDTLDVRIRAAQSLIVLSSPPEILG